MRHYLNIWESIGAQVEMPRAPQYIIRRTSTFIKSMISLGKIVLGKLTFVVLYCNPSLTEMLFGFIEHMVMAWFTLVPLECSHKFSEYTFHHLASIPGAGILEN